MRFLECKLSGVWIVELEPIEDARGSFSRTWCETEFARRGLVAHVAQMNTAYSQAVGTLRGLHFQREPHWETKVIRCLRGAAYVVAVDLRSASPTRGQHVAVALTADTPRCLYVPVGFAQGYQTLCDDTELLYLMSTQYVPEAASGYRFDDPAFAIQWPQPVTVISEKDQQWAAYA